MPKHISPELLQRFGEMLKRARGRKGLTQRDLGNRVGLPQSHISKIEQGLVDLQLSSLAEIARALDFELALVPRQALPAVEGVVKSLTPDPNEVLTGRARTMLAKQDQIAAEVRKCYPTLDEGRRFEDLVHSLQGIRIDPATLKLLDAAAAPARKIADYLSAGDNHAKLIAALNRSNRALQIFRDAQAHALWPSSRQQPALSLEEDADG
jgi:transcriptional regulator with XRE-family HTH domain